MSSAIVIHLMIILHVFQVNRELQKLIRDAETQDVTNVDVLGTVFCLPVGTIPGFSIVGECWCQQLIVIKSSLDHSKNWCLKSL